MEKAGQGGQVEPADCREEESSGQPADRVVMEEDPSDGDWACWWPLWVLGR